MSKKTRYLLDDKGGAKVSSTLSLRQINEVVEFLKRQGLKEVSKAEWYKAKKKWDKEESLP